MVIFHSYVSLPEGIQMMVMWVKQCHKPPMTGNGKHTTFKIVMTGGWFIIVLPTLMIHSFPWKNLMMINCQIDSNSHF